MGHAASQCRVSRHDCKKVVGDPLCQGDGNLESIGVEDTDDLDGDVKNSQALTNHKLLKAAKDGDVTRLQKMLAQGAYIETRRPFVMTPESAPSLGPGTSLRGIGLTPLMYAAQGGYTEACKVLLERGASVHREDEDGLKPLHFAASSGNEETCKVLLAAGADPFCLDDDNLLSFDHVPANLIFSQAEKRKWGILLLPAKREEKQQPPESEGQTEDPGQEPSLDESPGKDVKATAK